VDGLSYPSAEHWMMAGRARLFGDATALLCVVRHARDPVGGLARAAATSGDSDSIACLAGAFLGAAHGMPVWPAAWTVQIGYADSSVPWAGSGTDV
jgi:ADP-ribosylglycohydrolase